MEHLGDLPDRLASHQPDQMRCTWTVTLEPACNWKLILENAMETYHTGIVHRDTVGAQTSRDLPPRKRPHFNVDDLPPGNALTLM